MTKLIVTIITTLLLISCGQHTAKKDDETKTKGNISTTISTDTTKLARLINLRTYKPTHAKFKYTFIDNSGQNERLTVPGPSDNFLQAILYFDTTTFKELRTKYFMADYPLPNFDKQTFNFEWLDNDTKDELLKSDTSYHGHPDYFLGLGQSGKLWLLDNKLLLINSTN